MSAKNQRQNKELIVKELNLEWTMERDIGDLGGGELQRFAIAMMCIQEATV
jgi:ATP-binding cassette subfamily E protein 1